MFATGETVGLAKWIIDGCRIFSFFLTHGMKSTCLAAAAYLFTGLYYRVSQNFFVIQNWNEILWLLDWGKLKMFNFKSRTLCNRLNRAVLSQFQNSQKFLAHPVPYTIPAQQQQQQQQLWKIIHLNFWKRVASFKCGTGLSLKLVMLLPKRRIVT